MSIKELIALITVLMIMMLFQPGRSQDKLAQTGFQFLSVNADARAAALGGAMTTVSNRSASMFSNPAMLAEYSGTVDVMLSRNNWIADILHNAVSLSFAPSEGYYGVFAASLFLVDYGEIEGTIIAKNELGYLETGLIKPSAFAFGIGYARALSDRFSVGANIRYVSQNLGPAMTAINPEPYNLETSDNQLSVMSFDFGTIYKTGFKSLAFGMSVNNFSQEIQYVEDSFQLPLTFNIGVSMNLAELLPEPYSTEHILLTVDANHPRSHPEQVKFGLEYTFKELLAARVGYISNADEEDFSFGFGVAQFGLAIDYAYTPFGVFDKVQRFTIRFSM